MGTADQAGVPRPVLALAFGAGLPSPAVNQDTAAVLVTDSLEDVLPQVSGCPRQPGCRTGRDGTVRLIKPPPGWEDCLDLAFTEITACGASPAGLG
jgi:uncharacterized membrane protein